MRIYQGPLSHFSIEMKTWQRCWAGAGAESSGIQGEKTVGGYFFPTRCVSYLCGWNWRSFSFRICWSCAWMRIISYPTVTSGYLPPPRRSRRRHFRASLVVRFVTVACFRLCQMSFRFKSCEWVSGLAVSMLGEPRWAVLNMASTGPRGGLCDVLWSLQRVWSLQPVVRLCCGN